MLCIYRQPKYVHIHVRIIIMATCSYNALLHTLSVYVVVCFNIGCACMHMLLIIYTQVDCALQLIEFGVDKGIEV